MFPASGFSSDLDEFFDFSAYLNAFNPGDLPHSDPNEDPGVPSLGPKLLSPVFAPCDPLSIPVPPFSSATGCGVFDTVCIQDIGSHQIGIFDFALSVSDPATLLSDPSECSYSATGHVNIKSHYQSVFPIEASLDAQFNPAFQWSIGPQSTVNGTQKPCGTITPPAVSPLMSFGSPYTPRTPQLTDDWDEATTDDDDTDYIPSDYESPSRLPPLTQRSAYKNARMRRSSSFSPSSVSSSSPSPRARRTTRLPPKQRRTSTSSDCSRPKPKPKPHNAPSRCMQVGLDYEYPEPANFHCAICGHVQKNKRMPDMQRHIGAHYAKARKD